MIINKTEAEKRKDIVENVNSNIFVEAGAGAGKTTLIVKRITNQIRQGSIKPEELVVITFTNKAAGELFERIQKAFEEEEKNPVNTKEQRERFTYAIEHLEQMHISTIHSFCFTLLKERCFEAKLPIGVSLLENADARKRQRKFFSQWFAKLDKASIEEIKEAITFLQGYPSYYAQTVEEMFCTICEKPRDIHCVTLSDAQLSQLRTDTVAVNALEKQLLEQLNDEILKIADKGIEIYERLTGLKFYPDQEGVDRTCKSFYTYYKDGYPNKTSNAKTYNGKVEALYGDDMFKFCLKKYEKVNEEFYIWLNTFIRPNNLLKKYEDAKEKKKESNTSYAYYVILKYALMARDRYLSQLNRDEMSNDQLIQNARDLVCNSVAAREYFGEKYKCIYVDEFQDTDHIQADLVWTLATDEAGVLKPGALFVVGDPKQAIYRFRGGEPAVYMDIKKRMSGIQEAEVYELDNNFRSNDKIISWVNKQFKPVVNGSGINYRDMICVSENTVEESLTGPENASVLKGVFYLETLFNGLKGKDFEKARDEAEVLALIIKELVSGNYYIYENKEDKGSYIRKPRRIRNSDFLVLCWDTKQMEYYIDAMKRYAIPLELAGRTDIQGSEVLENFLALYRFVMQPYDRKSVQGARQVVYRKGITEGKEIANSRLERIRIAVENYNAYGKAQYLLNHPEYLFAWGKDISKEEMDAQLSRLHQMVENVFALSKEEPENLIKAFEGYLERDLERELILDENLDAVRLMNLHKAKGLEGNITIITNRKKLMEFIPEYKASQKNADGTYDYYGVFKCGHSYANGYLYDNAKKVIKEKAEQEEAAEKIRLEYVAATRAKEVLIFTTAYKSGAIFSRYSQIEDNNLRDKLLPQVVEEQNTDDNIGAIQVVNRNLDRKLTQEMRQEVYVSLSPSDLEGNLKKDVDNKEESQEKLPRRPKGKEFGTTMHRTFELYIQNRGVQGYNLDTYVCQAIIENADELLLEGKRLYLEEGESEELYLNVVREFLTKALQKLDKDKRMQTLFDNAKGVYTELPFSYYTSREDNPELFVAIEPHLEKNKIQVKEGQPVWINGTADLVIQDKDEKIHIIDFKSDRKKVDSMEEFEEKLYGRYEGQLLLYKYSMSLIFNVDLEDISTELYHLY